MCASPCTGSAGYYGSVSGLTTPTCLGVCSAGYYCVSGATVPSQFPCTSPACLECQLRVSQLYGPWCFDVPPGGYLCRFSVAGSAGYFCPAGSTNGTAALCPAGYYCLAGASTGTSSACLPGQFSSAGAVSCSPCDAGTYGASPALNTSSCTGPCSAGSYCPAGSSVPAPAACPAGFACPSGSANGTAFPCPSGTYSVGGAATCTPCAAGQYGTGTGLTLPVCSGPCDVGRYGNATGLTSSSCSGPCPDGRYGSAAGMTSSQCSGACAAGFSCPAGSTNATTAPCAPGQYSTAGAAVCTNCSAGYTCPTPQSTTPTTGTSESPVRVARFCHAKRLPMAVLSRAVVGYAVQVVSRYQIHPPTHSLNHSLTHSLTRAVRWATVTTLVTTQSPTSRT